MKRRLFLSLLLAGLLVGSLAKLGWAQTPKPPVATAKSVSAFLRSFREQVQGLGNPADSVQWPVRQQRLTKQFFMTDSLMLPNTLVAAEIYHDTHPLIREREWVAMLPRRFWQGFRVELDEKTAVLRVVGQPTGGWVIEARVPVGLRGIFTDTRQAHRLTETWVLTLETRQAQPKPNDWRIRSVRAIPGTARPAPLTRQGAIVIRNAVQSAVNEWLMANSDSSRRQACGRLRTMITGDTIFFQTSDKKIQAVAIEECRPPKLAGADTMRWEVASFSLTYLTDFYRSLGSTISAERTQMDAVRPDVGTEVWYTNRRRAVVPVSAAEAASGPCYWTVSRLVIHP